MKYTELKPESFVLEFKKISPQFNWEKLERVWNFALKAHGSQRRASGEEYIIHPMNVAYVLAQMEMDCTTVAAGLLHDVVEDTSVTMHQIEQEFGAEIAQLVDGVTKVGKMEYHSSGESFEEQAENYRKLLFAVVDDVRVIFIKLADRIHNMRTLKYLPEPRQKQIAQETLEIYVPLANRFGITSLKWELEDLCLKHLYPDTYKEINDFIHERKTSRDKYVTYFVRTVEEHLLSAGIEAHITGRSKHFFSIFRKKLQRKLSYDEIYDYTAIRIVVNSIDECYQALDVINSKFHPLPERFKDYIALPKDNGYRSIHHVIISEEGRTVEIQIRTQEMHLQAEEGSAAHWRYKEFYEINTSGNRKLALQTETIAKQVQWLRDFLKSHPLDDSTAFLKSLKSDLNMENIIVKTPKGDYLELPSGSTPLDFAFSVHTDLGFKCKGAKVNGRIAALDTMLSNGDTVQIILGKEMKPSKDWLLFLKTTKAKQKVRSWFRQKELEDAYLLGQKLFDRFYKKTSKDEKREELLKKATALCKFDDEREFLTSFGKGSIDSLKLWELLYPPDESQINDDENITARPYDLAENVISLDGIDNILVHFAKCCNPVRGDNIVGYVTRGRGITIHLTDCTNPAFRNLLKTESERIVKVVWDKKPKGHDLYPVRIVIDAMNKPHLQDKITITIAKAKIKIHDQRFVPEKEMIKLFLTVLVQDKKSLEALLVKLKKVKGVLEVKA
ncbi:MAG: bifunctional (p)ppGpp synthetase/guanosine-3',5'-bis(diphosphate) 3'-pyrophosphohydrolase [Candidatus Cloacimonetes bacterium]|nr:bifunctional (p)ppGpp synthetase/guanosine-3',5'-bis(diphosphate) 3'-pyrophosphohydrolase [Candidatus Cloacimonadota bacterium]